MCALFIYGGDRNVVGFVKNFVIWLKYKETKSFLALETLIQGLFLNQNM